MLLYGNVHKRCTEQYEPHMYLRTATDHFEHFLLQGITNINLLIKFIFVPIIAFVTKSSQQNMKKYEANYVFMSPISF